MEKGNSLEQDENREAREKAKRSLLWWGIVSICMMFSGFISAFLVIRADQFWVQTSVNQSFIYSTVCIVLSSLTMFLAHRSAKNNHLKALKLYLALTLLLGLAFGKFQIDGWKAFYQSGNAVVERIISLNGEILLDGKFGEDIDVVQQLELYLDFEAGKFYAMSDIKKEFPLNAENWTNGSESVLLEGEALSTVAPETQRLKLWYTKGYLFAEGDMIREYRLNQRAFNVDGQLVLQGEYGKDFSLVKNEEQLIYANGYFFMPSDAQREFPLNARIAEYKNTSSSFVYLLTFLHFLHLLVGLIWLTAVFSKSLSGTYTSGNMLGIELSNTYWHFLDGLWLVLFFFLFFIH